MSWRGVILWLAVYPWAAASDLVSGTDEAQPPGMRIGNDFGHAAGPLLAGLLLAPLAGAAVAVVMAVKQVPDGWRKGQGRRTGAWVDAALVAVSALALALAMRRLGVSALDVAPLGVEAAALGLAAAWAALAIRGREIVRGRPKPVRSAINRP